MTTMISNLPRDLIEEIVSRVPSKSMRLVRLTCKKWNTITKSQSFSKMHICKEARDGESQMIVMMNNTLHLVSVFVGDEEPSREFKGKLTCLNEQVKISMVFHCEGLLLCILQDDTKVVVWNPYSGQTRWIEPRFSHQGSKGWFMNRYRYALGYVNNKYKSCRSHKILRFFDDPVSPYKKFHAPKERFEWYEIYDFDSDSWTTLDFSIHWFIRHNQPGVSLKGNTYWCASERNSEDKFDTHIICFDFTRERFGPLMPLPFSAGDDKMVTLCCVREEKLAVLLTHTGSYEIKIWTTTKIEAEKVSWSRFLTLNTEPDYPLRSHCGFFIAEEKKVAMGFDDVSQLNPLILSIVGEDGCLRKLQRVCSDIHVCSYVPSLVEIKQLTRSIRKRHCILEERRFDEKMSRVRIELEKPEEPKEEDHTNFPTLLHSFHTTQH